MTTAQLWGVVETGDCDLSLSGFFYYVYISTQFF